MLSTATAFVLSLALSATALPIAPLSKRVAQVIAESTQPWVTACQAAGGGAKCNEISVAAFSTLLAAPGPCAQQDAADAMIDLAKSLPGDTSEMISLAQIFRQQARNAPDSLAVLYCQEVPRNPELNGLFQCQFEGVKQDTFTGNLAVGAPGTIPLGLDAPLSPPGSCPANPAGPIPDGVQLHTLTRDPGVPGAAPPAEGGEEPSETASETASATESAPTEAASETASVTESVTETPSATEAPSETASATESANTATGTDGTVTVTQTVTVTAGAAECTVTDNGKNNNKGNGGAKGRKGPQRNRNKDGQRGRAGQRGGANGGANNDNDNEAPEEPADPAAQEPSTTSAAAPEPTEPAPAPARQRRPNAAGGHH